jgi:hypothetical protein
MGTNAPKQVTLWIAVVLAVLGLIGYLVAVPVLTAWAFWLVLVGFVLLLLGCVVKGL